MSVLPVLLTGSNQKSCETYAFLDNGSSATFITARVANKLGLIGDETTLTLTTIQQGKALSKVILSQASKYPPLKTTTMYTYPQLL